MEPFVAPFDAFHDRTTPKTWLEGLVKAYVGDGIASDFYREISAYVDPSTRDLVVSVLDDLGHSDFVVNAVRRGDRGRPVGRRPAGAVGPAAGRRGAVAGPAGGGRAGRADHAPGRRRDLPGADLAELARMFARLTDEHTRRMDRLGLTP